MPLKRKGVKRSVRFQAIAEQLIVTLEEEYQQRDAAEEAEFDDILQ